MPLTRTAPVETADVETREPQYSTTEDNPTVPGQVQYPTHRQLEQLANLPHTGRRVPFAAESRKLVVMDYGEASGQVTLDGTGAGAVDLGSVPNNQYWIIDSVIARGGAAGSILLYERGNIAALNDLDIVYARTLLAPAFAHSDWPSELIMRPGAHVFAGFVGAGNALVGTAKIMYRLAVLIAGSEEGSV